MKTTSAAILILIAEAVPGWAVLGQSEASVSLDQQVLRGTDREQARQGYRVHQLSAADGTVIKEFVSPAGLVFGVAWQSPHMPDLEQLLGTNVTELQVALQSQSKGRRHGRAPLIVRTGKLVFVSGGHLRSFHGYAYVPSLVPGSVSAEVVQ